MSKNPKRERWERVSPKRLWNVQEAIRVMGNMANPASYQYDSEEAESLIAEIEKSVDLLRQDFGISKNFQPEIPPTPQPKSEPEPNPILSGNTEDEKLYSKDVLGDVQWALERMDTDKKMAKDLLKRAIRKMKKEF